MSEVDLEFALSLGEVNLGTRWGDVSLPSVFFNLLLGVLGETELGGDENFLSSREFHLGSS